MILDDLANYITSLMTFEPTKVLIGRENATKETFAQNYIVVDTLTASENISSNREYDSETERETLITTLRGRFTLEFYGDNAEQNANTFVNLQSSQKARDLQKSYGISVFRGYSVNNLKQIYGNRYFNRYEIEVIIQYNISTVIDTLRIEEIPISYKTD